jgi:hypothetical protein
VSERLPVKEEKTFNVRAAARWLLVLACAVFVILLLANARGTEHHRGDEVGALRAEVVSLS